MKVRTKVLIAVATVALLAVAAVTAASAANYPPVQLRLLGQAYRDWNNQVPTVYVLQGSGLTCLLTDQGGIWCK